MKRWHVALAVVILLALWEFSAVLIHQPILPGPYEVFRVFYSELSQDLGAHFLASLQRVLASILLSILIAAPTGRPAAEGAATPEGAAAPAESRGAMTPPRSRSSSESICRSRRKTGL